jgi:hypothetical protein
MVEDHSIFLPGETGKQPVAGHPSDQKQIKDAKDKRLKLEKNGYVSGNNWTKKWIICTSTVLKSL